MGKGRSASFATPRGKGQHSCTETCTLRGSDVKILQFINAFSGRCAPHCPLHCKNHRSLPCQLAAGAVARPRTAPHRVPLGPFPRAHLCEVFNSLWPNHTHTHIHIYSRYEWCTTPALAPRLAPGPPRSRWCFRIFKTIVLALSFAVSFGNDGHYACEINRPLQSWSCNASRSHPLQPVADLVDDVDELSLAESIERIHGTSNCGAVCPIAEMSSDKPDAEVVPRPHVPPPCAVASAC